MPRITIKIGLGINYTQINNKGETELWVDPDIWVDDDIWTE